MLLSSSFDGTIKIWDFETFKCIKTLKTNNSFVLSITCDEKNLFSSSADGIIRIWSLDTYNHVRNLTSFENKRPNYLTVDETYFYAQLQNTKLLQKWEKEDLDKNCLIECDGYTGGFKVIDEYIYSESYPNINKINKHTNEIVSSNHLTSADFYTINIDEKYIYTGIMVFSRENYEKVANLGSTNYEIHNIDFDDNNVYWCSTDIDYIPVWEKESWELIKKLDTKPKDKFECILVTSEYVIAGGLKGIYIWSKDDWKLVASLKDHKHLISSLEISVPNP